MDILCIKIATDEDGNCQKYMDVAVTLSRHMSCHKFTIDISWFSHFNPRPKAFLLNPENPKI